MTTKYFTEALFSVIDFFANIIMNKKEKRDVKICETNKDVFIFLINFLTVLYLEYLIVDNIHFNNLLQINQFILQL
jgi:hypothetical protein